MTMTRTHSTRVGASVLAAWILAISAPYARAQWSDNPIPVCVAPGNQRPVWVAADGQGGAIVAWEDGRPGGSSGIYAQRISHAGVPLWTSNVVHLPLGLVSGFGAAVSDRQGGALVAWNPGCCGGMFAQRVGPDGQLLWPAEGVAIPATPRNMSFPAWVADGSGGGIITWLDGRGMGCDVYANRLMSDGRLRWPADGIPIRVGVCDSSIWMPYDRPAPSAASDGSGGGIICWTDYGQEWPAIFAQRVDSMGVAQWAANGVAVCDVPGAIKMRPVADADGAGGALIAWQDTRITQYHVFVQRIDANGQALWSPGGQTVDSTYGVQGLLEQTIVSDGSGGALVAWSRAVSGEGGRYVQRISAAGTALWSPNGVLVSAPVDVLGSGLVSDGDGGAICTWLEPSGGAYRLLAQHIDGDGHVLWEPGGILVASGARVPVSEGNAAVEDGTGAVITAWEQGGTSDVDLYAQRATLGGPTASVEPQVSARDLSVSIAPNPSRGATVFSAMSARSQAACIAIFDLQGRRVRDLGSFLLGPASQAIRWDGLDSNSRPVGPGIYLVHLTSGSDARSVRLALVR